MITVIGLGFVGLTTALGFCHNGYKVYGIDNDMERIKSFKKGIIPFYEPHLQSVLEENLYVKFIISETLSKAIDQSTVIFICVGTPTDEDGRSDLKYIYQSLRDILKEIDKSNFKLLVIKSTVPPSTTKEIIKPFIENLGYRTGVDVGLVNNPEFLREGFAWTDFITPDRIIIGGEYEKDFLLLNKLYEPFNAPIFNVSLNTCEFIKYLSNTLLSTLISFSNEMSMIADIVGNIDIAQSYNILHLDKRWSGSPAIMTKYVYPGCGFGGYCLPKDTLSIITKSIDKGYSPLLLKEVLNVNDKIKDSIVRKIAKSVGKNSRIGILGLSFKPNSDDVRNTPAKDIIDMLINEGYNNLYVYDPMALKNFKETFNYSLIYEENIEDIAIKCDYFIIITGWNEFKEKRFLFANKIIFDLRYYL